MTIDNRTPAEIRYDLQKSGALYFPVADEEDTCPACEGAGCSECDGSPLTEEEIEDDETRDEQYLSVRISPACWPPDIYHDAHTLCLPPRITRDADGALQIEGVSDLDAPVEAEDPPMPILEVVHLVRRGLVIVDAGADVYVMTEAEYTAREPIPSPDEVHLQWFKKGARAALEQLRADLIRTEPA